MTKALYSPSLGGRINSICSKSEAHRLLICAALSDNPTKIDCRSSSEDINATVRCLNALGAKITHENGVFTVEPIIEAPLQATLDCGESGSTLRFLLPVVCALGVKTDFIMHGRLAIRPMTPLISELEAHGAIITQETDVLHVSGRVKGSEWTVAADISSQFVSGLLFMLCITGGRLKLNGKPESVDYITMTVSALERFGVLIKLNENRFEVSKRYPLISPHSITVSGDWSNAAFFLVAGAIGKKSVTVKSLDINSTQGDKRIVDILRSMGAEIEIDSALGSVTAHPSRLIAANIDVTQIPDLMPILSVAATAAKGTTRIFGAARLRLKESDRLESTGQLLKALGAQVKICDDGLIIDGGKLHGATVFSAGDHRIAMSAAVAATLCDETVSIDGAQAVDKSYPAFWNDFEKLSR